MSVEPRDYGLFSLSRNLDSRFQSLVGANSFLWTATATLDPRPRLWTRDPLPAASSQTPLNHNITRYDRCIIHYIRQMYLSLEKAVFKFSFFTRRKHCLVVGSVAGSIHLQPRRKAIVSFRN